MEHNDQVKAIASIRCWNGIAARQFSLMALAFVVLFVFRKGVISYLSIIIAVYLLFAGLILLMGAALVGGKISFPRTISRAFPFMVVGRLNRAVAELDEINYIGKSFGSEWVTLRFGEEKYPVPFASRKRRLAFFEAVQAQKPSVKIYRAS